MSWSDIALYTAILVEREHEIRHDFRRSFSRKEQKKMERRGAFMGCFVVAFTICTVFKPEFGAVSGFRSQNVDDEHKRNKRIPTIIPSLHPKIRCSAIAFSTGGYAGNHFHDFTDLLIPLYLTSHQFDKKVIFLVSDKRSWWTSKYRAILENLSKYKIIYIDDENHLQVLCFRRMTVGLRAHKELGIDSSEPPHYSMTDFRRFLRRTYSLDREFVNITIHNRPKLLIVSRRKTRHLTNEGEVADVARGLGFEVVVQEMGWQVSQVAKFVNGFDVMVGVHGAGLTNMVFLPENGVVIQMVPIGLDMLGKYYFRVPAKDMKLRYLEYKVSLNESSLMGKYGEDSEVYRDPVGVRKKGWHGFRSVYLDNQDVNVDLGRFKETLMKALELVRS
ncbi:hypothetical protein DH2020_038545 [Rehmannia glutinosa]|uniref:Glycosyltransferase 61 catalytic domain-containing protein n=1 Tax=Rehmannia glutinosa TaxID=99300 RepID=A0ABR0V072_REHGL